MRRSGCGLELARPEGSEIVGTAGAHLLRLVARVGDRDVGQLEHIDRLQGRPVAPHGQQRLLKLGRCVVELLDGDTAPRQVGHGMPSQHSNCVQKRDR